MEARTRSRTRARSTELVVDDVVLGAVGVGFPHTGTLHPLEPAGTGTLDDGEGGAGDLAVVAARQPEHDAALRARHRALDPEVADVVRGPVRPVRGQPGGRALTGDVATEALRDLRRRELPPFVELGV